MNKHVGNVTEVINRNIVVTLALRMGFNAFLPVYDNGIDFILYRAADDRILKVQLKSRWTIDRKYLGRDLWIAFPAGEEWYLAPHDELVKSAPASVLASRAWKAGAYSTAKPSAATLERLADRRLTAIGLVAAEAAVTAATDGENGSVDPEQAAGDARRRALDDLKAFRRSLPPQSPLTAEEILEMRDEGRQL